MREALAIKTDVWNVSCIICSIRTVPLKSVRTKRFGNRYFLLVSVQIIPVWRDICDTVITGGKPPVLPPGYPVSKAYLASNEE